MVRVKEAHLEPINEHKKTVSQLFFALKDFGETRFRCRSRLFLFAQCTARLFLSRKRFDEAFLKVFIHGGMTSCWGPRTFCETEREAF